MLENRRMEATLRERGTEVRGQFARPGPYRTLTDHGQAFGLILRD